MATGSSREAVAAFARRALARVAAVLGPRAAVLVAALAPRACAVAGALAGLLAGWFGLAAGLLLGIMLDVARAEARARAALAAFLADPELPFPEEPMAGLTAAAGLALRGEWPGPADLGLRRELFERLSAQIVSPNARARRSAERLAEVASRCRGADLPGLARRLATSPAPRSRALLADWAFAQAALGGSRLDPEAELELRASLGDCGLGAAEIAGARAKAFPGERDPWTALGLAPGASRAEIKRAYRRLSRLFHPDAAASGVSAETVAPAPVPAGRGAGSGADAAERFRELSSAYAELIGKR